jgi:sulfide:quinone oxidoreductase
VAGLTGPGWRRNIFDFYTLEGALALHAALAPWQGGDLVVHLTEMPIKCPVAPLEFCFLLDWWLARQGLREKTNLVYVTPMSGAFTRHNCSVALGHLLTDKHIHMHTDFALKQVDAERNRLQSYDGREVGYDLLVTIPTNMGDAVIERSGLGDDLRFVPVNKHTLQAKVKENIFVIGDASDAPVSKAGSVAHFQAEVLTKNIRRYIAGQDLLPEYDGHANCFIESGYGKAILIDFNYEVEPVAGRFPLPILGPLPLLKESRLNHWGKLALKWIYWHVLLRGWPLPLISARMQTAGKKLHPLAKSVSRE